MDLTSIALSNGISGLMVTVLVSSVVDRGFKSRSGKSKTSKLVFVVSVTFLRYSYSRMLIETRVFFPWINTFAFRISGV
jgi:hypothetical protein